LGSYTVSSASDVDTQAAGGWLRLEPVLDLSAAERLHAQLLARRGQPLAIDASQVERLGGLSLQVLLSARNTWQADGGHAAIGQTSAAFDDAWAMFAAPAFNTDQPHPFGKEGPDA
jgi:chemotaxis protein CheX